MSMIRSCKLTSRRALLASALGCTIGAAPGCAAFAARNGSTVAQGKYYDAGDARYADFFVGLYLLQVEMEQAPHQPELARLNLAHSLGLAPLASPAEVGQRLQEEALKLGRSGLRMRLDQNASSGKPAAASAAVRTSERPQQKETQALLAQVENSATNLLRSSGKMKEADGALDNLELTGGGLDASVDKDFASAPSSKLTEVKKNLEDAHRLIALMKARAAQVQSESDELLATIAKAINTDDGSLGSAASDAAAEAAKNAQAESAKKTAASKARGKPRPTTGTAAPAATRPKPASNDDSEAPAPKPSKTNKAAAAPKDFEP